MKITSTDLLEEKIQKKLNQPVLIVKKVPVVRSHVGRYKKKNKETQRRRKRE